MQNIFGTGEEVINALELEDRFVGQLHGGVDVEQILKTIINYSGFFLNF